MFQENNSVEMEEVSFTLGTPIKDILSNQESRKVFDSCLPGIGSRLEGQKSVLGLAVGSLSSLTKGMISEESLRKLGEELSKVKIIRPKEKQYSFDTPMVDQEKITPINYDCISNGKPIYDTDGKRINTHGGAMLYENRYYYWYGENKAYTDGKSKIWTWGIKCYQSKDLYNWKDLGYIIEPIFDKNSNLYPEKRVDRPHIVKCNKTNKYVCYIKLSGDDACFIILSADNLLGPYKIEKENYRPFDYKVGDFDLYQEGDDCYLFMDADHKGIFGFKLSDDFLQAVSIVSKQYENLYPPFTREAATVFKNLDTYYMVTSGMSGYLPNPSLYGVSKDINMSFENVGNPHVNDDTFSSFNSQISDIIKVKGKKDLYLAIADRWVPNYMMDKAKHDVIERAIAAHSDPEKYHTSEEDKKVIMESPMLESANTSLSQYVLLPLIVKDNQIVIKYFDNWKIEDYE